MKRLKTQSMVATSNVKFPLIGSISSEFPNEVKNVRTPIRQSTFIKNLKKANEIMFSHKNRKRKQILRQCVSNSFRDSSGQKAVSCSVTETLSKIITEDIKQRNKICPTKKAPLLIEKCQSNEFIGVKTFFNENPIHADGELKNIRHKIVQRRNRYKEIKCFRDKMKKLSFSNKSYEEEDEKEKKYLIAHKPTFLHQNSLENRKSIKQRYSEKKNNRSDIKAIINMKQTDKLFRDCDRICEWEQPQPDEFQYEL